MAVEKLLLFVHGLMLFSVITATSTTMLFVRDKERQNVDNTDRAVEKIKERQWLFQTTVSIAIPKVVQQRCLNRRKEKYDRLSQQQLGFLLMGPSVQLLSENTLCLLRLSVCPTVSLS